MPSKSKAQQKFFGIVRSIQKGEAPKSKFSKSAQDAAKDMKKSDVKKYAATKHKGLPRKVRGETKVRELIKKMVREILDEEKIKEINEGELKEGFADNFIKTVDKHNQKIVNNALALAKQQAPKDIDKSSEKTPKLIAIKTINRMKELRNKTKSPALKQTFQKTIDKLEKDYKKIKEQMNEAYRSQSIFFDKKDKSKLQKLLKKKKGKFPFNPFGEPVVNWSLDDRGSKGIEWSGIPKYNYDKAVEFFMKNKLNPRG